MSTIPAPLLADRLTLQCRGCGHTAIASAALAQHRLACPSCGEPLGPPEPDQPAQATPTVQLEGTAIADAAPPEPEPAVRRSILIPAITLVGTAGALVGGLGLALGWFESPPEPSTHVNPAMTTPVSIQKDFPRPPALPGPMGPKLNVEGPASVDIQ